MTPWLRRIRYSHTAWQVAAVVAFVTILFLVLRTMTASLSLVLGAIILAYILDPLVEILARARIPRGLAATIIILGFLSALLLGLLLLLPRVAHDIRVFGAKLPALAARSVDWLEVRFGIDVPTEWEAVVDEQRLHLETLASSAARPAMQWLKVALSGVFGLILGFFDVLLVIVFTFYFLLDWQRLTRAFWKMVPPRHCTEAMSTAAEIDRVLAGWIRGMLLMIAIECALYAGGLFIVGIPLAIPIGIAAGVLSFIPYIGFAVGLGLSLLMSLLDWQGWGQVIGVGVVFGVVQLLESAVLTPKLVGKRVGLSDIGALVAVVIGADLLGFAGMMLAIPMAAALAVVMRRVQTQYHASVFYNRSADGVMQDPVTSPGGPVA